MKTITPKATRHRRWVRICAGAICALAAPILLTHPGLARAQWATWASTKPDCGGPVPLCAEVVDTQGGFGYYVGHDENEVAFYSTTPGSGNHMRYQLTLPRDPGDRFRHPTATRSSLGACSGSAWRSATRSRIRSRRRNAQPTVTATSSIRPRIRPAYQAPPCSSCNSMRPGGRRHSPASAATQRSGARRCRSTVGHRTRSTEML